MKNFKKLMALVIAAVMVLGAVNSFAAPATVESGSYDNPLKVTGLDEDDVAHFYKVIEWCGEEADNVSGWKAIAPFTSVLDKATLTKVLISEGEATQEDVDAGKAQAVGDALPPMGITSELAGQLARCVTATTDKTDLTVGTGETGVSFDNPAPGLWMALITPSDQDVVYNPVFVGSDFNKDNKGDVAITEDAVSYSDEAAAKRSKVELTKTASVSEENYQDAKWNTTRIGETVSYNVDTTIPGFGEVYQNPTFILRDSLKDLALKKNEGEYVLTLVAPTGLQIKDATHNNNEDTDENNDYDYEVSATDSGYTITFAPEYLKTLTVPTAVQVKYDAIVTTDAPVHVNTEQNTVSTEFSHNPNDETDHGFKKDTTQHYTFTLDAAGLGSDSSQSGKKTSELVKVGVDGAGNPITETRTSSQITEENYVVGPLADAEFGLFTDAACTKEYKPLNDDGTEGAPLTLKSGADGRFTISGLDAGTYYLMETKAPTGYVKDTRKIKIEIIATMTDPEVELTEYTTDGINWISASEYNALNADAKKAYKSYTYTTAILEKYEVKINDQPTATYNFTNIGTSADIDWTEEEPVEIPSSIINTKGVELPSTGGMGTTLFYAIGAILVLGAGILLVSKRRMSAN